MFGNGQCSCVYDNEGQTQEMSIQVTGGNAENQLSGVLVNRVPRSGGNSFAGDGIFLFANDKTQGQNIDDALRARGLASGAKLYQDYDLNYSGGGPIIRDRLWLFASGRNNAYNNYVAGAFKPDGSPAIDDNNVKAFPARLTYQADPKNRFTAMFDWANKVRGHRNLAANVTPAASVTQGQPAEHIMQAKWTSTMTNHLLLEVGYTQSFNAPLYSYEPEVAVGDCHTAFNLCPPGTSYGSIAHQDITLDTQTVAALSAAASGSGPAFMPALSHVAQASLSYVSGAHSFKVGIQDRFGYGKDIRPNINGDIVQQYRNGVPSTVLALNTPFVNEQDVNSDLGVFVQDTWTSKRLTLNPGIRWDHFNSSIPALTLPAGRFVPVRQFRCGIRSAELEQRLAAHWRVLRPDRQRQDRDQGELRRVRASRRASPSRATTLRPCSRPTSGPGWMSTTTTSRRRTSSGRRPTDAFGVRRNRNPDPNIKRPYQCVWDVGNPARAVRPAFPCRSATTSGAYYNIIWTQNLAIPASSYTLLTIPDPSSTTGDTIPIYNAESDVVRRVNQLDTNSSNNTQVYKGVDASFNLRMPGGGSFFGGTSTGRTLTNTCDANNNDPNSAAFLRHQSIQRSVPNGDQIVRFLSSGVRLAPERDLWPYTGLRSRRSPTR